MQTRNPVLVVVFSFLTLGFYGLYWIATTQNALNRKTGMGSSGVTTIILSMVTFGIYGIYWFYLLGKEIRGFRRSCGLIGIEYTSITFDMKSDLFLIDIHR